LLLRQPGQHDQLLALRLDFQGLDRRIRPGVRCRKFPGPAPAAQRLDDLLAPGPAVVVGATRVARIDGAPRRRQPGGEQQQVDVEAVSVLRVDAGRRDVIPGVDCQGVFPEGR
jgi:hypothetical protein